MPEMCLPSKASGSRVLSLLLRLAAASLLLFGIAGCGTGLGTQPAQMRVAHASFHAGPLDVLSSKGTSGKAGVAYNLSFGTVTSYFPVTAPTYTVASTDEQAPLATAQLNVSRAKHYTLLVQDAPAGVLTQVLADQDQPAPTGYVALRFANEMLDGGLLDLYLVPQTGDQRSVEQIAATVSAGTSSGYIIKPSGTYTLYAMPSGIPLHAAIPWYVGASVQYASGTARTLVLLNQPWSRQPEVNVITLNDFDPSSRQ